MASHALQGQIWHEIQFVYCAIKSTPILNTAFECEENDKLLIAPAYWSCICGVNPEKFGEFGILGEIMFKRLVYPTIDIVAELFVLAVPSILKKRYDNGGIVRSWISTPLHFGCRGEGYLFKRKKSRIGPLCNDLSASGGWSASMSSDAGEMEVFGIISSVVQYRVTPLGLNIEISLSGKFLPSHNGIIFADRIGGERLNGRELLHTKNASGRREISQRPCVHPLKRFLKNENTTNCATAKLTA